MKETSLRTEEIKTLLARQPGLSVWALARRYRCSTKLVYRLKCEVLVERIKELELEARQ